MSVLFGDWMIFWIFWVQLMRNLGNWWIIFWSVGLWQKVCNVFSLHIQCKFNVNIVRAAKATSESNYPDAEYLSATPNDDFMSMLQDKFGFYVRNTDPYDVFSAHRHMEVQYLKYPMDDCKMVSTKYKDPNCMYYITYSLNVDWIFIEFL